MRRWLLVVVGLWAVAPRLAVAQPAAGKATDVVSCRVEALTGVRSQLLRALHDGQRQRVALPGSIAEALGPAQAADFSIVARAVLGDGADAVVEALVGAPTVAAESSTRIRVPCSAEVRRRDDLTWRMGLAGYSAREIADVAGGHLSLGAVQQARARLMAGRPRSEVSAFLEAQWRDGDPAAPVATTPASPALSFADLEPDLVRAATEHGLAPALVRAVIAAESGGDARAVSPKGAIGLMQLMPATAAALGVDPWQPRENLRGGVAYLAVLLRDFGNSLRLALIAYNAGPQHARAVQAGRAVAYRETRVYLDAIRRRYPVPSW